jgi:hypothetical protein
VEMEAWVIRKVVAHVASDELATTARLEAWLSARDLSDEDTRPGGNDHRINFPLTLTVREGGGVALRPSRLSPVSGLGNVLAELQRLADTKQLDRLKMCASEECHWVFFDRSKPANRRWCSSALCGNRQKTRAYRERRRR